jgi:hypothetical protein
MKFFQGRRNKISRNPKPKLDAAAVATELSNAVKRPKSGKKKNTILPGDKPCLDFRGRDAAVALGDHLETCLLERAVDRSRIVATSCNCSFAEGLG